MVYKGCDIGSAKPSKAILEEFPHEMIDIVNPSQIFTVSDFCNLSNKICLLYTSPSPRDLH